jgi:succinoglycan biosynthesis transport protein ExoP
VPVDESGATVLRQYLQVLRRRWWVIVLIVAVAAGSALAVSERMTPVYQAHTQVNVTPFASANSQNSGLLNLFTDPNAALQTDVTLIESPSVLVLAAKSVGLASPAPLQTAVTAKLLTGTQVIDVQAASPVPAQAASWANAVGNAFIAYERDVAIVQLTAASQDIARQIASLKAQIPAASSPTSTAVTDINAQVQTIQGELDSLPGASSIVYGGGAIISPAPVPTHPASPNKKQNLLLGAVVGLLLAIGLVLLIEALDDRLRTAEEVVARVGSPVLGAVPYAKELSKPAEATMLSRRTSAVVEAYRTLRINLRFLSLDRPLRTLLVTSSVKGEGKSTTAANLAAAFAASGVRTILVSGDLRWPSTHRFFGLQNSVGVVDAVLPEVALEALLQTNQLPNLRVLAAGLVPPNPTEILGSERFAYILEVLKVASDLVIIDSPPLLGVADASALASRVDGVLLVVNFKEANRSALDHATEQLRKAGGRLLGTALNAVDPGMGSGYGYEYDYDAGEERRRAKRKRAKGDRGSNPGESPSPRTEPSTGADPRPSTGAGTTTTTGGASNGNAIPEPSLSTGPRHRSPRRPRHRRNAIPEPTLTPGPRAAAASSPLTAEALAVDAKELTARLWVSSLCEGPAPKGAVPAGSSAVNDNGSPWAGGSHAQRAG